MDVCMFPGYSTGWHSLSIGRNLGALTKVDEISIAVFQVDDFPDESSSSAQIDLNKVASTYFGEVRGAARHRGNR